MVTSLFFILSLLPSQTRPLRTETSAARAQSTGGHNLSTSAHCEGRNERRPLRLRWRKKKRLHRQDATAATATATARHLKVLRAQKGMVELRLTLRRIIPNNTRALRLE